MSGFIAPWSQNVSGSHIYERFEKSQEISAVAFPSQRPFCSKNFGCKTFLIQFVTTLPSNIFWYVQRLWRGRDQESKKWKDGKTHLAMNSMRSFQILVTSDYTSHGPRAVLRYMAPLVPGTPGATYCQKKCAHGHSQSKCERSLQ